jgi:hypothetical protein
VWVVPAVRGRGAERKDFVFSITRFKNVRTGMTIIVPAIKHHNPWCRTLWGLKDAACRAPIGRNRRRLYH